jgi:ATP-dependent Zn protease
MKGEDRSRDLSLLFYLTANQQNLQYVNKLSTQAYEMEDREKTIQAQIVKLSKEIADINAQIDKLNIEKGLVGTIRVIQQPEVSPNPVGTSTKQILLLTGVASLFMFIFCAFLIEYIRNATSQKKTEG